ncbi:MAG: DUF2946 domain-containing protein [Luteibacter sp.]|uniref:DUF2946 domain-containing protein n=1 Tax=Luteibacter TaxID=242605 RepID=UPI00068C3B71|nr:MULTISPECIES: DUF2946 domain-containing protein [unclassified Luteibacter]MDQ7995877.1 DUF2946 domain-containing protein [Luteibacter sp.]MDQ8049165.1 DUF2946 domain-containing protein [Luteibacter sp.]MDR6642328.1 hypothetical protein [Luteibacter sp. 1214]
MRWLGWMATVAVWLTVLAPTVSRALPAFAFPDLGAWCDREAVTAHHGMPGHGHDMGGAQDADDACGYCALFAQTPALGGGFFVARWLPLAGYVDATLPARRAAPSLVRHHAPTRGPPVAAHA